MSFSEQLKLSIRRRAHFRCCLCRAIGVEIHHILPKEENGPDTEDNAAPLCPSCHEIYGANPTKRKFIREARDFWYETCSSNATQPGLTLADLSSAIEDLATKNDINDLKNKISTLLTQNTDSLNNSDSNPVTVPLERFIRSLYDEHFENSGWLYSAIFDSRFWYESGADSYDLLDRRAFFLKTYGEETAKQLCSVAGKAVSFHDHGFTEEDFGRVVSLVITTVILVTQHKQFVDHENALECAVRADGEFLWRHAGPD